MPRRDTPRPRSGWARCRVLLPVRPRGAWLRPSAPPADPTLTEALHEGGLSSAQLAVVTNAATEAPESTEDLLKLVDQGASHQELTDTAARKKAAAREPRDRAPAPGPGPHQPPPPRAPGRFGGRAGRVLLRRGGMGPRGAPDRGPGQGAVEGGRWRLRAPRGLPARRPDRAAQWLGGAARPGGSSGRSGGAGSAGGSNDPGESGGPSGSGRSGRLRWPGGSGGPSSPSKGSRCQTIVVIDAAALRRGTTEGDELCEIEGIGPVSVEAATELLSEGSMRFVIREGFDIKTVTKLTRDVAATIEAALMVRDRTCARPGCGKRLGLQIDHRGRRLQRRRAHRARQPGPLVPRVPRTQDPRRLAPRGQTGSLGVDRARTPQERQLHRPGPQTCGGQGESSRRPGPRRTTAPRRRTALKRMGMPTRTTPFGETGAVRSYPALQEIFPTATRQVRQDRVRLHPALVPPPFDAEEWRSCLRPGRQAVEPETAGVDPSS